MLGIGPHGNSGGGSGGGGSPGQVQFNGGLFSGTPDLTVATNFNWVSIDVNGWTDGYLS